MICLLASLPIAALAADVSHVKANCKGAHYDYVLFSTGYEMQPAILLLHGAGGSPDSMIEAWAAFAKKNGIALIAPSLPRDEKFEGVAPAVFHCVLDDALTHAKFDAKKVYVFGYSMGGYLAFDVITLDAESYAGGAIFANGVEDQYASIFDQAKRKVPVALYIGDADRVYPIAQTRRTQKMLQARGYTLHYRELPKADHDYFAFADEINAETWKFWQEHSASKAK
ncbi:alpha/beta fold hydrolase [Candidatus Korobacter versatilis]|nr:alpha/beta fold hydrolase [Candidatus Koribacter versatilis]